MADLVVNIGGNAAGLQKAAKQAVDALSGVDKAADNVSGTLGVTEKATSRASSALKQGGDSTRQAQIAMTNLNRVVQDAPFGFIAIQNNIDPLVQSFVSLRQSTGSTGAAIKGLLSAFAGPAGILSLISLASAAFVAFGPKIEEAFNKGKAAAEEARKSFEAAVDSVLKFEAGPAKIEFEGNRQATLDAAQASDRRLQELRAQLSEFEGGLFSKNVRNLGASGRDKLNALLGLDADALLKSFSGQGQEFEARKALVNLLKEQVAKEEELNKKLRDRFSTIEAEAQVRRRALELLPVSTGGIDDLGLPQDIIEPDLSATIQAEKEFTQAKLDRIKANITLEAQAQKAIEQLEAESLATMDRLNAEDQALIKGELAIDQANRRRAAQDALNKTLTAGQFALIQFGSAAATSLADVVLGFEKIENVLDGLRSVLRNVLRDLAAAAVKAAILNALFPGGAQAAGGFKGIFGSLIGLRPFATGGIVTGPTPALIGEAGPEAVIPLDRISGLMQARPLEVRALRVSGGDLLLTLQEAQLARGGGAISLS